MAAPPSDAVGQLLRQTIPQQRAELTKSARNLPPYASASWLPLSLSLSLSLSSYHPTLSVRLSRLADHIQATYASATSAAARQQAFQEAQNYVVQARTALRCRAGLLRATVAHGTLSRSAGLGQRGLPGQHRLQLHHPHPRLPGDTAGDALCGHEHACTGRFACAAAGAASPLASPADLTPFGVAWRAQRFAMQEEQAGRSTIASLTTPSAKSTGLRRRLQGQRTGLSPPCTGCRHGTAYLRTQDAPAAHGGTTRPPAHQLLGA
jgi:hypothetical protein